MKMPVIEIVLPLVAKLLTWPCRNLCWMSAVAAVAASACVGALAASLHLLQLLLLRLLLA